EAVEQFRWQTSSEPRDSRGWFLRAIGHDLLLEDTDAVTCYTVCIALNPNSPHGYLNRGRVYARGKRWTEARRDFDSVIVRRDDLVEPYAQRATAAHQQGDFRAAERDLTRALELDGSQTRFYFLRARVREKAGDMQGAVRDREEGMRRRPNDAAGWL